MSGTLDLEKLKQSFDFDSFLVNHEGYQLNERKSRGSLEKGFVYRIYTRESHERSVLYVREFGSTGITIYKDLNNDSDKGTIIDYLIKSRGFDTQQAIDFIKETTVDKADFSHHLKARKKTESVITINRVGEFTDQKFLSETRRLSSHLLKHHSIRETLCDIDFTITKGNSVRKYSSYAFKHRNAAGEVKNYYTKSATFRRGLFTGIREDSLWYSDPSFAKNIIIGESAIDVLSLVQVCNLNPDSQLLISSEGRYTSAMSATLKKIIPRYKYLNIALANDHDIAGTMFSILWLADLFDLKVKCGERKLNSDGQSIPQLVLTFHYMDNRLRKLFDYHDAIHNTTLFFNEDKIDRVLEDFIQLFKLSQVRIGKPESGFKDWNDLLRSRPK